MKANYHNSLHNKPHTKRIILIGLCLMVLAVVFRPMLGGVVSYFNSTTMAVSDWFFNSSGTIPSYFRDRDDLIREIEDLKSKIASFDGDRKTVTHLMSENQQLKSLLSSTSSSRVLATVIGRPPQLPFDALLLDVGSTDGVEENALVYIQGDKAIGLVARVYPHSSVVALATSPGVESSVYVIGPDIYATAIGDGGGVLRVNVPQGLVLEEGDPVVVPAFGSGIYGLIHKVVSIPTEPVQNGYVTIGTPIQSIRAVTVSLKPLDAVSFEDALQAVREAITDQLVIDIPETISTTTATSSVPTSTAPAL